MLRIAPTASKLINFSQNVQISIKTSYNFMQDKQSKIYQGYIQDPSSKLKLIHNNSFKFQTICVPRIPPSEEEIKNKLESEWKNKKIIVHVDPSGLLGCKRSFVKTHYQKNIYQGLSEPDAFLSKINPSFEIGTQELKFDHNLFLMTDPVAQKIIQENPNQDEQQQQRQIYDALSDVYEQNPQRFANRLKNEYNVPEQYQKLIELAMYNENPIYFCGINEYAFRNMISKFLTLSELKDLFMLSLKYAMTASYKYKKLKDFAQETTKLQDRFSIYGREILYLNYYKLIKKIQNGEIIRRIKPISQLKQQQLTPEQQETKPRGRGAKKSSSSVKQILFAHSYTLQTLQEYSIVNNLNLYKTETRYKVHSKSEVPVQQIKQQKSSETDAQKIQKHAILQVMLGNLWNKIHTFDRFPYLSEDYHSLNQSDRQNVKKIYFEYFSKYTVAKRVYYQKNVNKLNKMTKQQSNNAEQSYQNAIDEYNRYKQKIQKQKRQSQSKKQKTQENLYEQYQSQYEQTIEGKIETPQKQQSQQQISGFRVKRNNGIENENTEQTKSDEKLTKGRSKRTSKSNI